jgi:hypothetical protein
MALLGQAILAFSHDVTAGHETEWIEWHDREHIPERLSLPGFLRLRRYAALDAGRPALFYFYEAASAAVLQSPAYLERLGHPTPWTRQCMQYVCNNSRTVCRVSATLGRSLGGILAVVELGPRPGAEDGLRRWLIDEALPAAVARPGMVAAHLGEADAAATLVKTEEKTLLPSPDALARWLVMIEGVEQARVRAALADVLGREALLARGADLELAAGTYQLSFVMEAGPPAA